MKTLDELFDEINSSKELQEKIVSASESAEELMSFFREQGCEADVSEIKRKLSEASLDQLAQVSGGVDSDQVTLDWLSKMSNKVKIPVRVVPAEPKDDTMF